ncbi:iron chelate uptake ABC transporter family permease subunit [Streptomyces pulveraceus]|uniref:FecCD family ABC transporter permease n=1 Tax=Streptomyces pulveraceus TaxID=68258 RepID=A0ABW1GKV9_9ACTN
MTAFTSPAGRRAPRPRCRVLAFTGAGCGVLLLVAAASVALGSRTVGVHQIVQGLAHTGPADVVTLIREVRIPRTAAGLVAGAALGAAGILIQAVTRNPLGDPGLLGVNSGSGFAVTLTAAFTGSTGVTATVWSAFAGAAAVTALIVVVAAATGNRHPGQLVLVGVALGAVFSGIQAALALINPRTLDTMRTWSAGTLTGIPPGTTAFLAVFVALGLIAALTVARGLDMAAMGEDLAKGLGTRTQLTRVVAIAAITLLAGSATALAGPLSFLGLMVPHLLRPLIGPGTRRLLLGSLIAGPVLLLTADVAARLVVRPGELPVGVVTAFLGAPLLLLLLHSRRGRTR